MLGGRIALIVDRKLAVGRVLMGQLFIFWEGHQAFQANPFPPDSTDGSPTLGEFPAAFWASVAAFDQTVTTSAALRAQGFTVEQAK